MNTKLLLACLLLPLAASVSFAETNLYYRPLASGFARYKFEAIRLLVTPSMRAEAVRWSSDERVQELITMAQGLDSFVYDGLRLVKLRGMVIHNGAIDEEALGKAMIYFNVTKEEAKAWLLASRVLQLVGFKEGVSLTLLEEDMATTAEDLMWRLRTYYSEAQARRFMPHFIWAESKVLGFAEAPQVLYREPILLPARKVIEDTPALEFSIFPKAR